MRVLHVLYLSTLLVILVRSTGNRKQHDKTDKNHNEEVSLYPTFTCIDMHNTGALVF